MEYKLFGSLDVSRGGIAIEIGGLKQRAVLAVLLVAAGDVVDFDRLIDDVWGAAPPPKAKASLRAYVANLRRLLSHGADADRLITTQHGYRLDLGNDTLDTHAFEASARAARSALAVGDADTAFRAATAAMTLWRGDLLPEFHGHEFARVESVRLGAMLVDVVDARFDAGLRIGKHTELIPQLEAAVAATPLREPLWGYLLRALTAADRGFEALHAYDRATDVLQCRLGVGPSDFLRDLADGIRRNCVVVEPAWETTHESRRRIVGRTAETAQLHDAHRAAVAGHGSLLVVCGENGIGKTALVSAFTEEILRTGFDSVWVSQPDGVPTSPLWAWTRILRELRIEDPIEATAPAIVEALLAEADRRERSVVVVLDNLEISDAAAVDVLDLIVGRLCASRILLIVLCADCHSASAGRRTAFDRIVDRSDVVTRRLRGLRLAEVANLFGSVGGCEPTPELIARLHRRTGGNPFYVREIARTVRSFALPPVIGVACVPDSVAGVIRRRVSQLPRAARHMVEVAAVIGDDVDVQTVADAAGSTVAAVQRGIDAAVSAGLMVAAEPTIRFANDLVRQAVGAQVGVVRRAEIHARIGVGSSSAPAARQDALQLVR
ncbi:BTAD domain-containing putative transcriptional regulator [Antrihabitans cavernicola]|uniref:BTAD domain-containing putative transcriptional regulator n=1 Tax=Antrihabitans cavernicola TaxID=2495913 RepID=UPI00165A0AF7|nr:BTAD domain-containing putative transcriptional regulator [Spelaeibacter cavernicola]